MDADGCDLGKEGYVKACMQEICRLEDSVLERVKEQISQAAQRLQCDVTRAVLAQLDDDRGELLGAVARVRLDLEERQHSLHTQVAALAETLVCEQGPMSKMAGLEADISELRNDILCQRGQQQLQMQRLDKVEGNSSAHSRDYNELRSELRRDLEQLCEELEANWKRHANPLIADESPRHTPPDLCERVRELTATVDSTRGHIQLELKQEIGRIHRDLVVELEAESSRWNTRIAEVQAAVSQLEKQVAEAGDHWQSRQASEDFRMEELRSQVELVRLLVEEGRGRRSTAALEEHPQQQQQQQQHCLWSPMHGAAEEQQPSSPSLPGLTAVASTFGTRGMPGCAGTGELGSARGLPTATASTTDQHQGLSATTDQPEGVESFLTRLEAVESIAQSVSTVADMKMRRARSATFNSREAVAQKARSSLADDESAGAIGDAITAGVLGPDLRHNSSSVKDIGGHPASAIDLRDRSTRSWKQMPAVAAAAAAAAIHDPNSDEANFVPSMPPSKTCSTQALGEHDDAYSAISSTTAPPHYDLSFRLSGNSCPPAVEPCMQQDGANSKQASVVAVTARVPQPEGRRRSNSSGFGASVATVVSQATPQARHCDARTKFVQAQMNPSVRCPTPRQTSGMQKAMSGTTIDQSASAHVVSTSRTMSPQRGSSALARYVGAPVGHSRATSPTPRPSLSYQPAVANNGAGTQLWSRKSHSPLKRADATSLTRSFSPRSTAAAHLSAYGTTAPASRTPLLGGHRPTLPRHSKAASDVALGEATFGYTPMACTAQSMQAPSSRACSLVHTPRLSSTSLAPSLPVRRASSAGALVRA